MKKIFNKKRDKPENIIPFPHLESYKTNPDIGFLVDLLQWKKQKSLREDTLLNNWEWRQKEIEVEIALQAIDLFNGSYSRKKVENLERLVNSLERGEQRDKTGENTRFFN